MQKHWSTKKAFPLFTDKQVDAFKQRFYFSDQTLGSYIKIFNITDYIM